MTEMKKSEFHITLFVWIAGLVNWLVGRLVGWLVGWLVGRSVGRLVGRSVGGSVGRSVGRWSEFMMHSFSIVKSVSVILLMSCPLVTDGGDCLNTRTCAHTVDKGWYSLFEGWTG
jgi:hypothetical protein